jgi:hypothetical protein
MWLPHIVRVAEVNYNVFICLLYAKNMRQMQTVVHVRQHIMLLKLLNGFRLNLEHSINWYNLFLTCIVQIRPLKSIDFHIKQQVPKSESIFSVL